MLNNLTQVSPVVNAVAPGAITVSGKISRFPVNVLLPLLAKFENVEPAMTEMQAAMLNATQVPLLNELRQIWLLTKIFGEDFSMIGGADEAGNATSVYHAELGILTDAMRAKYAEKFPTINIDGCYLCLGIDGNVLPLVAKKGRGGRMVLTSPPGIEYDLYPDDEDVSPMALEVSLSVMMMGKYDIPTFSAMWDQYHIYTGRVAAFRETKPGVQGFQDRFTAQEVVRRLEESLANGGAAYLTDHVREITAGGGGDKFGVPFSIGAKGIYPIADEGVFIVPSADGTFDNTLVACHGPNGVQKFRLSPQQGQVLQGAISSQYPVTDATGKTTAPAPLFASLMASTGMALAYISDRFYEAKKGKYIGQQMIAEEVVLIPHAGKVFIDQTGKEWDPKEKQFIEPAQKISTDIISTFFEVGADDGEGDETIAVPEAVFAERVSATKKKKKPVEQMVEVVDGGDDEEEIESPPAKKTVATASPVVVEDDDYESDM